MSRIAEAVFSQDLADNFEHHGWLQHWQQQIPGYIDWQTERNSEWQVSEVESRHELILNTHLRLTGQLDRIDRCNNQLGILDYKTGQIPRQQDVLQGEAVQLPLYALLATSEQQPVREVAYLELGNTAQVGVPYALADADLPALSEAIAQRLSHITQQLIQGAGLPAWGDSKICSHCDMKLLCRRQSWDH